MREEKRMASEVLLGHVTSTGDIHFRVVTPGITHCFEGLTAGATRTPIPWDASTPPEATER
ncbi:hypothetical protein A3K89_23445 [Rhodococcoides kyotonense]|uniref:Uncharacterized protein n=1 Tax=Rhodococcoides kyotonense TaxID=398843 RepID=A0A177YD96_9NOCA|nr:hypothetical protein A3K89_23445 [Rhodococcus kyotonensis]